MTYTSDFYCECGCHKYPKFKTQDGKQDGYRDFNQTLSPEAHGRSRIYIDCANKAPEGYKWFPLKGATVWGEYLPWDFGGEAWTTP